MAKPAFQVEEDSDGEQFFWRGSNDIFDRASSRASATSESRVDALLDNLCQPVVEGDHQIDGAVGVGFHEGGLELPLDIDEESDHPAEEFISDTGKRERRKVGEKSNYITIEDFHEGKERDCFKLIYNHARFILGTDATPQTIARGVRFFFCQSEDGLSFAETAAAISSTVRIDIILLRFQYEFWMRYMIFPEAFDWTALPVPQRALNQFSYAGLAMNALDVCTLMAAEIWYKPGMHISEIIGVVNDELPGKFEKKIDENIAVFLRAFTPNMPIADALEQIKLQMPYNVEMHTTTKARHFLKRFKLGLNAREAKDLVKDEFPNKYTQCTEEPILDVINHLTDEFLLSRKGDHLWVTVKNPQLQMEEWSRQHHGMAARHTLWWSRLF